MLELSVGLSGCKLELIENNIIRKYSSSIEYNQRLSLQVDKQVLFSNLILKNIDTPKIYDVNQNELYHFDMEYIHGESFYDYFMTSTIFDIEFVIQSLVEYFNFFSSNIRCINVQDQVLLKLYSLQNKTNYKEYLSFLYSYVKNTEIIVPKTFCHGDLTFANIIFHKNRLFFIDFLDSYIDSFYCDLVKLKQELYYFWNLRVQNKMNLRMVQIYKKIWDTLSCKYEKSIQTDEFEILDVMNTLRLEPYLTNDNQRFTLNKMVTSTKLYEKFNSSNGREI
jgi:tRNA A-37 threonylcarbamoyl transferase component Bud32